MRAKYPFTLRQRIWDILGHAVFIIGRRTPWKLQATLVYHACLKKSGFEVWP